MKKRKIEITDHANEITEDHVSYYGEIVSAYVIEG